MAVLIDESDVIAPLTEEDIRQFGRRVTERREKRGWKQVELSRRAGLGPTRLSRVERGAVEARLGELVRLHRALGLPVAELLFGEPASAEGGGTEEQLGRALRDATPPENREPVLRLLEALLSGFRQDPP